MFSINLPKNIDINNIQLVDDKKSTRKKTSSIKTQTKIEKEKEVSNSDLKKFTHEENVRRSRKIENDVFSINEFKKLPFRDNTELIDKTRILLDTYDNKNRSKETLIELLSILPHNHDRYSELRKVYIDNYLLSDINEIGYYDVIKGLTVCDNLNSMNFITKWYSDKSFKYHNLLPIPYVKLAITAKRGDRIPNDTEISENGKILRSAFKSQTFDYEYDIHKPVDVRVLGDGYRYKIVKRSESTLKVSQKSNPSGKQKHCKTKIKWGSSPVREVSGVHLRWTLTFKPDELPSILGNKGRLEVITEDVPVMTNGEYKIKRSRKSVFVFTLLIDDLNRIKVLGENGYYLTVGNVDLGREKEVEFNDTLSPSICTLIEQIIVPKLLPDKQYVRVTERTREYRVKVAQTQATIDANNRRFENIERIQAKNKEELSKKEIQRLKDIVNGLSLPSNSQDPFRVAYDNRDYDELKRLIGNRDLKSLKRLRALKTR
jgi:hypothetical protein